MKVKDIFIIILIILLLVGGWLFNNKIEHYKNEIVKANTEVRNIKISQDTLRKINETLYTKLVADTLRIEQLKKVADSLKLKVKNPETIIITELSPKDTIKETDTIYLRDGKLNIVDYYPNKDNPFLTYKNTIDLLTNKGEGNFDWGSIDLNLVIAENDDGTYKLNTQLPEYFKLNSLNVISKPKEKTKETKDFGIFVGAGYGSDYSKDSKYILLSGGIRYKKLRIGIEGGTNSTLEIGGDIEIF